jgi:hypothetical protein
MKPTPPPVRPYLTDRVHAALLKAGRPVTRGELKNLFLVGGTVSDWADVQSALDVLVAEGLAARGEEGPVRGRCETVAVYRAAGGEIADRNLPRPAPLPRDIQGEAPPRANRDMKSADAPPVYPYLRDLVHDALLRAARPVTRGELVGMYLSSTPKVADVQAALDALAAEGLAARGKAPGYQPGQTYIVWRAVGEGRR